MVPTASKTCENPPANIEALQLPSQSGKSLSTPLNASPLRMVTQLLSKNTQSLTG
jgi:hypothetical protein